MLYSEFASVSMPGDITYITYYFFSADHWIWWMVKINRFTNDIGYVPYVVSTIHSAFMNVAYRIRLLNRFVITWAKRRVTHVEQDLLTFPEHHRSPLVFVGVRVVYSLVFYVVSFVILFVCLSFSFLAMALPVCFILMSLTVPLVSFVPLL